MKTKPSGKFLKRVLPKHVDASNFSLDFVLLLSSLNTRSQY